MGLFTGSGNIFDKIRQIFSDPKAAWDEFRTGGANQLNADIANQNLNFQKERAAIEDARYADETAYNRAFAEDERDYNRAFAEEERDYNRALQQQLFEREDTALERQAQSLSSMGINPLSQQLNGLGAGSPVSSAPIPSASAPSASSQKSAPLNNSQQAVESGFLPALSSAISLADTINGVKTGQYQRDALALQNDKQYLENLKVANGLGIKYDGLFAPETEGGYRNFKNKGWTLDRADPSVGSLFEDPKYKSASGSEWRKMQKDSMPSWQYTLDSLGNDDIYSQAEKALTKMSGLFNKASENIFKKENYSENPFRTLFNLFF